MNNDLKNLILEEQIGKIGEEYGAIGGYIGGGALGSLAAGLGGSIGAKWAANKLKVFDFKDKIVYKFPIIDALNKSYDIIANLPNLIEFIDADINLGIVYLSAVIGSGFGQMNPTIICLEFIPDNATSTTIYISASAKEGLIKQKSAQKAVLCLKELLLLN